MSKIFIPANCAGICNCGHLHNGHICLKEVTDNCYPSCRGCIFTHEYSCLIEKLFSIKTKKNGKEISLSHIIFDESSLLVVFEDEHHGEIKVILHDVTPTEIYKAVGEIKHMADSGHVEWVPIK
ncbi:MAG: hypothetical protein ACP5SD_10880, partial [Elusimicrobiales bacterium]